MRIPKEQKELVTKLNTSYDNVPWNLLSDIQYNDILVYENDTHNDILDFIQKNKLDEKYPNDLDTFLLFDDLSIADIIECIVEEHKYAIPDSLVRKINSLCYVLNDITLEVKTRLNA